MEMPRIHPFPNKHLRSKVYNILCAYEQDSSVLRAEKKPMQHGCATVLTKGKR